MNRPRTGKNFPTHIIPEKLPTRVWYDKSGAGKWMIRYKDQVTAKWRSKRLCSGLSSLAEIWQAYEALEKQETVTFKSLSEDFQKTFTWQKLSISTKRDYIGCHNSIINKKTSIGTLGSVVIDNRTTGTVRKYRDSRARTSESRANKELSYIKRIFSWSYEYEKILKNPSIGVKKISIKPRQHYATDQDYKFLLETAKQSGYWYMGSMMEIAYLCRMRLSEVVDIVDADQLPEGLLIRRRKGSKNNIVQWTERLKKAVTSAKEKRAEILKNKKQPLNINPKNRYLFISERTGDKLTISSVKTAKSRIDKLAKQKSVKLGIEYNHFWFHDLKRKGVTDTKGDKLKASGHRSSSMMNIYDVGIEIVKPAGEK